MSRVHTTLPPFLMLVGLLVAAVAIADETAPPAARQPADPPVGDTMLGSLGPPASGEAKPPTAGGSIAATGSAAGLPRMQRLVAEKKPVRVVAYGDSISEVKPGWNGGARSPAANWAAVLVKRLGEKHPGSAVALHHFAIGGQNTYEGLGRLDGLESLAPDLVLVAFGANDCCHHFLEPVETRQALAALVTDIRTRFAADIVVVGTGGDNPRKPFFRHLDATLAAQRTAAAEAGVPFVDVRAPILEATSGGDRWADFHLAADNCHPSDAGHLVWAEAALRTIETALASPEKDRAGHQK